MEIKAVGGRSPGSERTIAPLKEDRGVQPVREFSKQLDVTGKQLDFQALEKMMQEVDRLGEKLASSRTVKDMLNYKRAVQRFVQETVGKAYEAKEQRGWDRSGRPKIFVLVKQIDKELEELSKQVMEEQSDNLEILKKLGEIRGLLVDMYS